MEHTDKPLPGGEPRKVIRDEVEKLLRSDYSLYLAPLEAAVRGRVVASSAAGTSGFVLTFLDGSWVATYLEGDRLAYELGADESTSAAPEKLNSNTAGDGGEPLTYDRPYANERCDIAAEVTRSMGSFSRT